MLSQENPVEKQISFYDYGVGAGILHVADHYVSPGKKQWTWGCGDFGKAWDRNLTDEDGPYVELMTGVFTDNQPADIILYQGLSYLKLGMVREARARFYRLIDYSERHLDDEVKIQYFAVSLPEFLIFDDDYTMRSRAHCYYLMALGNMGLGDAGKAAGFLAQAVSVEPSHMMSRVYQSQMKDK